MSFTIAGKENVGPIGLGLMGFHRPNHVVPTEDAIATMKAALNAGATFWDAGENYGTAENNSMHLLNAYFTEYPADADKVFISVKGCFDMKNAKALNDEAGVTKSIENCLSILDGKCKISLFQAARGDPDRPIEETVGTIAKYVKAGKIGCVGMSECSAASLRRALAVTPIGAVEIELSLFETGVLSNSVAEVCRENIIPMIAYSPLGRGFLTGQIRKYDDMAEDDHRKRFPRSFPENFDQNMKIVYEVDKVAEKKRCTNAQVAISWVSAQAKSIGVPVIPIPGTTAIARVHENMKKVELNDEELNELNGIVGKTQIKGDRYPQMYQRFTEV